MELDDIIPQYMLKLAYACVSMSVFESVNACVCVCVCVSVFVSVWHNPPSTYRARLCHEKV